MPINKTHNAYFKFILQLTPPQKNMKIQNQSHRLCSRFLAIVALALTATHAAHADYTNTVLLDNPLAFYPINSDIDPTGTTATDISGNGNNGTYNGSDPQFNTVPGPSPFIPNALSFDGFTSFVDLSTGSNPGMLNFGGIITMEAWVQPASLTVGSGPPADILAKGYDGTNEMTLRSQGGNYFGGTYSDVTASGGASGGQETTNWTYLVSTYDGANWNLYVNSKLVGQSSVAVGAINFTAPWAIGNGTTGTAGGNSGNLRYFTGNITEVALYTNALTPAQVLNHFCAGELGTSSANSRPIIITQPQPQTAAFGGMATFSVEVVSALLTTNQWFKNGVTLAGKTNSTLTLTNVSVSDATNYSVVVGNVNGTTNSVSVSLTVVAANSLKWNSGGTSGVWDTGTTADWLNLSNSTQTVFSPFDQVLFDDTIGVSNNVTVGGTVSPSLITVNSSTNNFTISSGTINGSGGLVKNGSSTLSIFNSGTLTGPVTISGGSVYAGNNTFSSVASIAITNNATWDIGGATITGNKSVTVSGTGVNGNGAIFDSYGGSSESLNITLAGNTTLGGSARWDLGSGSQISGPYKVRINWSTSGNYGEWSTVTVATNVGDIELVTGKLGLHNMGSSFGNPNSNLIVDGGTELDFWDGGCGRSLHVLNNGKVQIFTSPTVFTAPNVTLDTNAQWYAYGGSGVQTWTSTFTLNGVAHILVGDADRVLTNVVSGPGGFVYDGFNHQMVLSTSNTYTGPSVIGDGEKVALTGNGSISHSSLIFFGGNNASSVHFDVTGRSDQTLTLASGQTLSGIGTINGGLVVAAGATLSPSGTNTTIGITTGANSTGTISASNAIVLQGTTILKLNGSGVNDQVQTGAGITFGGALNLVNVSGTPLANGNSFQIASAASYSGTFTSITPATPGAGLAWDTSQLNTLGFLNVVSASSQPVIGSTRVSGGNLIFSGTNGVANGSYVVLTSTNVATPLTNWTALMTNTFDGTGAFSVTNAITPNVPDQFYIIKQ